MSQRNAVVVPPSAGQGFHVGKTLHPFPVHPVDVCSEIRGFRECVWTVLVQGQILQTPPAPNHTDTPTQTYTRTHVHVHTHSQRPDPGAVFVGWLPTPEHISLLTVLLPHPSSPNAHNGGLGVF